MAALSAALNFAKSSLSTVAGQTAVASRNVTNANQPDYSRKTANVVWLSGGSLSIAGITRSADQLLLEKLLHSTATAASSTAIERGVNRLAELIGDPQDAASPAGQLGKFQSVLETYAHNPADQALARNALQGAANLVHILNSAGSTIQDVRQQADNDMGQSVEHINNLLQQYKVVNDAIVRGSGSTADLTENLDTRDKLIKQVSEEIGITTITRPNNDIALYTESGVTLFETIPRSVTFQPSPSIAPGTVGNAVYIDGVDITSPSGPMATRSGALYGLTRLRDDLGITAGHQMDEMARGLIAAFAETDQSANPTAPPATGLFSYAGGPALPADGTVWPGLSMSLKLNAAVDPAMGGDLTRLRDGGMNGASFVYNQNGGAAFSQRLSDVLDHVKTPQNFASVAGLETRTSLSSFSQSAAGWVSALAKQSATAADLQNTIKSRSDDALQRVTGVSIDEEMTNMLELERSYQASAKLVTTVGKMIDSLLAAVN